MTDLTYLIALSQASEDMGIYPRSITNKDGVQTERTPWQDGWNAYGMELSEKQSLIIAWLKQLSEESQGIVIGLLLRGTISLRIPEDKKAVQPYVNCNDLFYWGCADLEDISVDEIPALLNTMVECPRHGIDLWVARKRGMRPQKPCYENYTPEEAALFDAAGPERTD